MGKKGALWLSRDEAGNKTQAVNKPSKKGYNFSMYHKIFRQKHDFPQMIIV